MKNIHKKALPNFQNAVIPYVKLTDYALNKNNSGGRDKAIAFENALGYTVDNAGELKANILQHLAFFEATLVKETEYGKLYEVIINLKGPNGKTANVLSAWIIKTGAAFPSLTSVYITKKKVKK